MAPIVIKLMLASLAGTALAYAAGSKEKKASAAPAPSPIPAFSDATPAGKLQKAQAILAQASKEGTPEAYSSAAYQLEQMGLLEAAGAARDIAKKLSQAKGPPPTDEQPHKTIETSMPADLSAEVARVLRDSQDPTVLDALAAKLRALGYTAIADQASEKAKQVRDVLSTAATMSQIQDVIKSPGIAQTPFTPAPPMTMPQGTVTAPIPKSPQEVAATSMTRAIFSAINAAGGDIKKAKKKGIVGYSQTLAFQSSVGLGQDGKAGPGTMLKAAEYVDQVLPPVLYWKQGATAKDVAKYRAALEAMAQVAESAGDKMRAASLRATAAAEHGQGGIVGTLLS